MEDKIRENRLRRMADRYGMRLVKSRRRDPRAPDYGQYWLIDHEFGGATLGGQWGVDLDEIEHYLTSDDED